MPGSIDVMLQKLGPELRKSESPGTGVGFSPVLDEWAKICAASAALIGAAAGCVTCTSAVGFLTALPSIISLAPNVLHRYKFDLPDRIRQTNGRIGKECAGAVRLSLKRTRAEGSK